MIANFNTWKMRRVGEDDVLIYDLQINLKLLEINYATFYSPIAVPLDAYLTIVYRDVEDAFYAKVTQCRKSTHTSDDGKSLYEIECAEPAVDLTNRYLSSASYSGLYIINESSTKKTLGEYVGYMLGDSGWKDISAAGYKNKTQLAGVTGDASYLPSMGVSASTVWSALQRVIVNFFNYGIWFVYPNGTNCVKYGEYNKDVHKYPVPTSIKLVEKSTDYNIEGVIVYGQDKTLRSVQGTVNASTMADKKILVYRYTGCTNQAELDVVAKKIYDERSVPRNRWEIEFPAGTINICEGDRLYISDDTMSLPVSTTGYGVKDVKITMEKTVVGIGASEVTIFDVMDDKLSKIDGDLLSFEIREISSDYYPLRAGTDYTVYGPEMSVDFFIPGQTFMGVLNIIPYFSDSANNSGMDIYAIDIDGGTTVYEASSSAYQVFSMYGVEGVSGMNIHQNWFPCNVSWVDVEVSYIFDTSTTAGASAVWDCSWVYAEDDTTLVTELVAHGVYETSSSQRRTITHTWSMPSYNNLPFSYPKLTFDCGENNITCKIKNLHIKVVMHVVREQGALLPNMSEGEKGHIDIKLQSLSGATNGDHATATGVDVTDWIMVYHYTNWEDFIGVSYNMNDYGMTIDNLTVGWNRIVARMSSNDNAGIKYIIQYGSIDESTKVIK